MSVLQKIKFNIFKTAAAALAGIISFTGCVEETFDSSELDLTPDINASVATPVGYRTFTMDDFFNPHDQRTIETDENGLLTLIYQTKFETPSFGDIFSIDDINKNGVVINQSGEEVVLENIDSQYESIDTTWIGTAITPKLNDSYISEIFIDQLDFQIITSSVYDVNVAYNVELPTLVQNNNSYEVALEANGSYSESLEGYSLTLQEHNGISNAFPVVVHAVFYPSNSVIPVNAEIMDYDVNFSSINYRTIFGNFSGYSLELPANSIDLDIYESIPEGTFHFAHPELTIKTENTAGLPVGFDFSNFRMQTWQNDWQPINGEGVPDNNAPWVYQYPAYSNPVSAANDSLTILYDEWNFSSHSDSKPEQVTFESQLHINPYRDPGEQFIHRDSRTTYNLDLKLPLFGYARFLSLADTMNFLISDFISKDYEKLEKAYFRFHVTNGFPIGFSLQVYLADANQSIVDSLFDQRQVILPAIQEGNMDEAQNSDPIVAEVDRERFEVFKQEVTHLISHVHIQTAGFSENAPTNIGIYEDQFLDINLGLVLDLNGSSTN